MDAMTIATSRPNMTPGRAALIGLLERYALPGYRVTTLEIQKLAYFLKATGEPMNIEFSKKQYGPYAETLHHVLQRIEGHFLRGYGDRSRDASLTILPGASEEAERLLQKHPDTLERLERVSGLIEGFETPYGLELLATVHWLAHEDPAVRQDIAAVVRGVHAWSPRKKGTFCAEHIEVAWQRLRQQQWI